MTHSKSGSSERDRRSGGSPHIPMTPESGGRSRSKSKKRERGKREINTSLVEGLPMNKKGGMNFSVGEGGNSRDINFNSQEEPMNTGGPYKKLRQRGGAPGVKDCADWEKIIGCRGLEGMAQREPSINERPS